MNEETLGRKAARLETRSVKKAAGFTGMGKVKLALEEPQKTEAKLFPFQFFPPKEGKRLICNNKSDPQHYKDFCDVKQKLI